jgi:hypothetical protein
MRASLGRAAPDARESATLALMPNQAVGSGFNCGVDMLLCHKHPFPTYLPFIIRAVRRILERFPHRFPTRGAPIINQIQSEFLIC